MIRNFQIYTLFSNGNRQKPIASTEIDRSKEGIYIVKSLENHHTKTVRHNLVFSDDRVQSSFIEDRLFSGQLFHRHWVNRQKQHLESLREKRGFCWQDSIIDLQTLATTKLSLAILWKLGFLDLSKHKKVLIFDSNTLGQVQQIKKNEISFTPDDRHAQDKSFVLIKRGEVLYEFQGEFTAEIAEDRQAQSNSYEIPLWPKINLPSAQRTNIQEQSFKSFDGQSLRAQQSTYNTSPRAHTVILLHGSGPENRRSGSGPEGRDYDRSPIRIFDQISAHLNHNGISTFSYDKRGSGESEGNWNTVTRSDLVEDALAAARFVKNQDAGTKIIFLGLSEGANLCTTLSQNDICDGVILGGGPAQGIDRVILSKLAAKSIIFAELAQIYKNRYRNFRRFFRKLKLLNHPIENFPKDTAIMGYSLHWWYEMLRVIPKDEIVKSQCPILLLHGEDDAEVLCKQNKLLVEALKGSSVNFESITYPCLNHFFMESTPGYPGFEYDIPTLLPERFLEDIVSWIKKNSDSF